MALGIERLWRVIFASEAFDEHLLAEPARLAKEGRSLRHARLSTCFVGHHPQAGARRLTNHGKTLHERKTTALPKPSRGEDGG
jgi:hypothetical protein